MMVGYGFIRTHRPHISLEPLGYCVVAEAGCNWYLSILIYSLYKKNIYLWISTIALTYIYASFYILYLICVCTTPRETLALE
jgi:hypothetical protein